MMTFEDSVRLAKLHERLKWGTREAMREDGCHKSGEAAMQVSFCLPPMFADDQTPTWTVGCYSYVLGPDGRNYEWSGRTLGEALGKAEDAIRSWCLEYELEAFNRMCLPPDGDDEPPPAEPSAGMDDEDDSAF